MQFDFHRCPIFNERRVLFQIRNWDLNLEGSNLALVDNLIELLKVPLKTVYGDIPRLLFQLLNQF